MQAQHNLNITTQGGEKHAINRTGEWLIAHGSANISTTKGVKIRVIIRLVVWLKSLPFEEVQ